MNKPMKNAGRNLIIVTSVRVKDGTEIRKKKTAYVRTCTSKLPKPSTHLLPVTRVAQNHVYQLESNA